LLSVARSTLGYISTLIARDAGVVSSMTTLGAQYPRYGYRTIRIFLERQGHAVGVGRMYRLWRQTGLQVPQKRPCRRVAASRPPRVPPTAIDHVWAYDCVFDTCADGRSLKCLTFIDEFMRECLAIDVAGGIRAGRVIEVLTQLVSLHGASRYLRSDNGREFVARRSSAGCRPPRSKRRISTQTSRARTAPTSRSTANCATSTSRSSGFAIGRVRR
jgi:putative transposase